jgi:hypothetical protein
VICDCLFSVYSHALFFISMTGLCRQREQIIIPRMSAPENYS